MTCKYCGYMDLNDVCFTCEALEECQWAQDYLETILALADDDEELDGATIWQFDKGVVMYLTHYYYTNAELEAGHEVALLSGKTPIMHEGVVRLSI